MEIPLLYRQLEAQLRQWVLPKDKRHLQGYAEAVAAILQSASACLSHWLPYMSHRDCKARAHMERLSYLVHNEHITAERFYHPLLEQVLQSFAGEAADTHVRYQHSLGPVLPHRNLSGVGWSLHHTRSKRN